PLPSLILFVFLACSSAIAQKNSAFAKVVEEDPTLPRVLLVGDSISIGYTVDVQQLLAGKANVHRIPTNAGHTGMGVANIGKWLDPKKGRWDVIHFNWGLWDLCYRNPESKNQGKRDKENGTLTHTPEQYAENLEKIVAELKKTGATLIFGTTTPVPEGEFGRKVGDDAVYNKAASEVMAKHEIAINDLHAVLAGKMEEFGTKPGDVHFKPEGSKLLAEQVVKAVEPHLGASQTLFDGSDFEGWELDQEGGWEIDDEGAMICRMAEGKDKAGKPKPKALGNIWSVGEYGDFVLSLSYKLSEGANSGVFYRSDKANPVQGGFEVQLMDNAGFQASHGPRDELKLNASFYDGKAPSKDNSNPVGEWNQLTLTCDGSRIMIALNGEIVVDVNVDDWAEVGKNPDGTTNKFKNAFKDFPRSGKIGFQNHGQVVWFKNVRIREL
ncbi:MAG: hypothetical protein ACI8UO_005297, partial [Verrucomicrobiales bacterium]